MARGCFRVQTLRNHRYHAIPKPIHQHRQIISRPIPAKLALHLIRIHHPTPRTHLNNTPIKRP